MFVLQVSFCSTVRCPAGTKQIGALNSNIEGCGIDGCQNRYNQTTVYECRQRCANNIYCKAFSYAPIGGDRNVTDKHVCTIYRTDIPIVRANASWSKSNSVQNVMYV